MKNMRICFAIGFLTFLFGCGDSGLAGTGTRDDATGGPRTICQEGQTVCNGVCLNAQTDASNCGYCGHVCPNGTCTNGRCNSGTDNNGGVVCGRDGLTVCGFDCVDSQTDPNNCGTCGIVCPTGKCVSGHCEVPPDLSPALDMSTVPDLAFPSDLATPPDFTAPRDLAPPSDLTPPLDLTPPGVACLQGETVCSGACVNAQTDASNCNACGTKCGGGQICQAGYCVAAPDLGSAIDSSSPIDLTSVVSDSGTVTDGGGAADSALDSGTLLDSGTCALNGAWIYLDPGTWYFGYQLVAVADAGIPQFQDNIQTVVTTAGWYGYALATSVWAWKYPWGTAIPAVTMCRSRCGQQFPPDIKSDQGGFVAICPQNGP